jgi:hypothetical protein
MRATTLLLLQAGCTTSYVDPVYLSSMGLQVGSHNQPPAVMYVLDKSGSMNEPIDAGCTDPSCATRISEVRDWTHTMLGSLGSSARWGLQVYPADVQCTPSAAGELLTPIGDSVGAGDIVNQVQQIQPAGGTPTAQSLAFTRLVMPNDGSEKIVVLVTDGLPNCNADNPLTCENGAACQCTLSACPNMQTPNDTNFCARGCLDEDATTAMIRSMTDTDVIVVGFGSDWSGASLDVLHAMAAASSGTACSTNNDCTTGSCMNGLCAATGFISHTALELASVTTALSEKLTRSGRCHYVLENALTGHHLRVFFDGSEIPAADVAHTATTAQILGSSCNRLINDSALTPEFRDAP